MRAGVLVLLLAVCCAAQPTRPDRVPLPEHAINVGLGDAQHNGASASFAQQPQRSSTALGVYSAQGLAVSPVSGYFDVSFASSTPTNVRDVVLAACRALSGSLDGDAISVPITVTVSWASQGANQLGSGGPSYAWVVDGLFYPDALANQLYARDLSTAPDIRITLNAAFASWHVSASVPPPSGRYDMYTTVVHELVHGLGFIGFVGTNGQYYGDGVNRFVYDAHMRTSGGGAVVDSTSMRTPSVLRARATDQSGVFFAEGWSRLYAPSSFDAGSSLYHLNELTYPPGDVDALMTPVLNSAERSAGLGPRTLAVLDALGWGVRACAPLAAAGCGACTASGCVWCRGACLATPDCIMPPGESVVDRVERCPECASDADCDDALNACFVGVCGAVTAGVCHYAPVLCDDGVACTRDLCDSALGCVSRDIDNACAPNDAQCGAQLQRDYGPLAQPLDVQPWLASVEGGVEADAGEQHVDLAYAQAPPLGVLQSVQVRVRFTKNEGPCAAPTTGNPYLSELYMRLEALDAAGDVLVGVQLMLPGSLTRPAVHGSAAPVWLTFDDTAPVAIQNTRLRTQTVRPVQSLTHAFVGRVPPARWRFTIGDTTQDDSACLLAVQLLGVVTPDVQRRVGVDGAHSGDACVLCAHSAGAHTVDEALAPNPLRLAFAPRTARGAYPANVQLLDPVPDGFFGSSSLPISAQRVDFAACDAEHAALPTISLTADASFAAPCGNSSARSVAAYLNPYAWCGVANVTVAYRDRVAEQWTVRASVVARDKDYANTYGSVVLQPACDTCSTPGVNGCMLDLYARLVLDFTRVSAGATARRVLRYDSPAGYEMLPVRVLFGACRWHADPQRGYAAFFAAAPAA